MSKYQKNRVSDQTRDEADRIARATQRPGQTKEQTRLIAQGIQKGIDQYKKRHKAKARELDRKLKQTKKSMHTEETEIAQVSVAATGGKSAALPWILLALSWVGFLFYAIYRD